MNDSWRIIFTHVSRSLPDQTSERKELLGAMSRVLPGSHPAQKVVQGMLSAIATEATLQAELPLLFAGQAQGNHQHSNQKKGKQ